MLILLYTQREIKSFKQYYLKGWYKDYLINNMHTLIKKNSYIEGANLEIMNIIRSLKIVRN